MSNRNSLQTSQKNVGENPARRRDREESEDEDVPQSGEMPTAPPEVLAQRVIRKVRRPPTTSLMEHAPPALEPDMAASRIQAEAAGNPFASLASSSALASTASSELFAKFQNEPSAEKKDQQDRVHHSSTTHKVETNQNATFKFSFVRVANQGGNDGSKGVFSDTELRAGVERAAGKPSNNTTCDDGVGVIRGVIDGHPEANSSEHGWVHKEANVLLRTGEEGEVNLVCCLVRAYVASKETKAWCEFSRGELRLNESLSHGDHVTPQDPLSTSTTHSPERRIVMRDEKTRKVILNTVLHPSSVTLGPVMDRKNFTFTTVTRVEQDGTDADGCINKEKEPEYVTRSYLIRCLSATTPEHFMKLHETIRMTLEEHNNVPSAEESK